MSVGCNTLLLPPRHDRPYALDFDYRARRGYRSISDAVPRYTRTRASRHPLRYQLVAYP